MQKPVIMSVDDEPVVLKAVGRDLHAKYQRDYQIMEANSGGEALDAVLKLKQRGTPVALFLVDQRMPDMSGTEFLARAVKFFPEAKKVLLTAYSDTEAAIQSINAIGLDFYMLKPWDPPENLPSVMSATSLPSPAPMIAEVGVSISGIPGPPFGPSYRITTTSPLTISFFSRACSISSSES